MMRDTSAHPSPPALDDATPSPGCDLVERAHPPEPVLCNHCGRTASNGISCIGACVADSGY
ncbi:MAG: hypothetical protein FJ077_14835 [Cyanobacteria bacterium K_DeepCast_35m_m2_023]|nr:hypothetical protein [Cyanobacteria bacterium K_DeepCast_35m_m2_023]